jgi:large subunit ribosomal protein L25
MDRAITVTVPILIKGTPEGVKVQGGMLDFVTRDLQVQCLPKDIPEHIDIDVSALMLHQSIRLKDVPENPKWKALNDPDTMLVHVVLPKAEEVAAPAEGEAAAVAAPAAPAEPEVIKKGKVEKEGEEPAAKK